MTDLPNWAAVREDYEAFLLTNAEICKRHGISAADLAQRRSTEHWTPRPLLAEFNRRRREAVAATGAAITATAPSPALAGPPAASVLPADDAADPKAKRHRPLSTPERREFVKRLRDAIEADLVLLERRLTRKPMHGNQSTDTPPSTPDSERNTRTIGLIIKNLEQLSEFAQPPVAAAHLSGAAAKAASLAASELADEADRRRRELSERLSRLVAAADGTAPTSS